MSDDFDITLERKLESKADGRGGGVTDVRRIELITGAGRRMELHLDYLPVSLPESAHEDPAVQVPIFTSTAHFYLNDMVAELGPTIVIPGSHRAGRPPQDETTWHGIAPQAVMVKAGDVCLFRGDLWHGAWRNTGEHGRRYMLQVHYGNGYIGKEYPPLRYTELYDPVVREINADYQLVRRRLAESRPDVLVTIASDHLNQWFMDNMPAFLVGKAPRAVGPFPHEQRIFGLAAYAAPVDQELARWFETTRYAKELLSPWKNVENNALAREEAGRPDLIVHLAEQLYKREKGHEPTRVEDLVGPYLKAIPPGYVAPTSEPQPKGVAK